MKVLVGSIVIAMFVGLGCGAAQQNTRDAHESQNGQSGTQIEILEIYEIPGQDIRLIVLDDHVRHVTCWITRRVVSSAVAAAPACLPWADQAHGGSIRPPRER